MFQVAVEYEALINGNFSAIENFVRILMSQLNFLSVPLRSHIPVSVSTWLLWSILALLDGWLAGSEVNLGRLKRKVIAPSLGFFMKAAASLMVRFSPSKYSLVSLLMSA